MLEGEASQESTAPEGASASPPPDDAPGAEAATPSESEVSAEADAASEPEAEVADVAAEAAEPAAAAAAADWSHVRGFQTVEPAPEALAARSDYAEELAKELNVRAARFARSVDDSIVLSSDGLLRWLGDPVARIVGGENLLAPRAVLLADDALSAEDRASAEQRLAFWIAAHLRKVLGPLAALVEGGELSETARALALKIAEALGVLEREGVRNDVRALDQTARGALRKLGVRFGALYIYVPALLKPAARSLSSLLWMLKRGSEPGADRLLAFAAAGRTSFANEGLLSPDSYRVAGFRLCGERVVRVDIIERLSDLIRAAIPDHMRSGSRPASDAYGFQITPQMTSLTGCSGEAFASILRSLGFEPHKVSKAAFEAARPKAPMEPLKPLVAVAPTAEAAPAEDAEPADLAEGEAEAPEAVAEEAEEAAHVDEAVASEQPAAAAAAEAEAAAAPAQTAEAAPTEAVEPPPEEVAEAAPQEETAVEAAPVADAALGEAAAVEAAADEEIEIWRPAPRRPRAPRHVRGEEHEPRHRDKRHRRHGKPPEAATTAKAEPQPAPSQEPRPPEAEARPPRPERRDEAPRRFEGRRDEGREERRPPKNFAPRRESRPTQVDPDSPFAKLAALKPLLERRDKRP